MFGLRPKYRPDPDLIAAYRAKARQMYCPGCGKRAWGYRGDFEGRHAGQKSVAVAAMLVCLGCGYQGKYQIILDGFPNTLLYPDGAEPDLKTIGWPIAT